jgi:long-subunit fatty acid transport protein
MAGWTSTPPSRPSNRSPDIGVTMVSLGLGWSIRDPADVEATIAAIGAWGRKHR